MTGALSISKRTWDSRRLSSIYLLTSWKITMPSVLWFYHLLVSFFWLFSSIHIIKAFSIFFLNHVSCIWRRLGRILCSRSYRSSNGSIIPFDHLYHSFVQAEISTQVHYTFALMKTIQNIDLGLQRNQCFFIFLRCINQHFGVSYHYHNRK